MEDKNLSICIIGGGISGVSAAHFLLKKGYKQITLLEKTERIGGKCHTIKYRGKTYEMGTIMGLPSYTNVKELMKEYQIKDMRHQLTRGFYNASGEKTYQLPKEERAVFIEQLKRLPSVLSRYEYLKKDGLGGVDPELSVPFSEWCKKNNLETVGKIYAHTFSTFGFGLIEEAAAAYVHKIISYENLMVFLEICYIMTWSNGISELLLKMADRIPELRLTQEVTEISRQLDGKLHIRTQNAVIVADRVISTVPLDCFSKMIAQDETTLNKINQIVFEDFYVYAFIAENIPELCGYIPENLTKERQGHMTIWYYRWQQEQGADLVTVYAYKNKALSEAESVKIIEEDLRQLGCTNLSLYMSKAWKHFPHVDSAALADGFYEHFESLQGNDNIYLSGEALSGSSMEKCISYSKGLVEKYF